MAPSPIPLVKWCGHWSVFHNYNRANMYIVIIKNAIILNIMHKIFILRDIHVVILCIILVKFVVLANDLIFLWHDYSFIVHVITCSNWYILRAISYRFWRLQLILVEQNNNRSKFFEKTRVSSRFDSFNRHDITEILLKVTLNTITLTLTLDIF